MSRIQWGRDLRSKCGRFGIERMGRRSNVDYWLYDRRFVADLEKSGIFVRSCPLLRQAKHEAEARAHPDAAQYRWVSISDSWQDAVETWDVWSSLPRHCPFCLSLRKMTEAEARSTLLINCLRFEYECGGVYLKTGPRYVFGTTVYYDWVGRCPRLERAARVGLPSWAPTYAVHDRALELGIDFGDFE